MVRRKFEKGKLYQIDLTELAPDPLQPRKHLDEAALRELTTSVLTQGVLQPVLARYAEDGRLMLVSGERRYQACLQAGLRTIPTLITDGDAAELALVENLMREDLTAIEEAEAIAQLKESHNYQLSDLSKALGKAESTLSEILSLAKLPDEIKDDCRKDPKTSKALLLAISKQATVARMKQMYKKFKSGTMTYGALSTQARAKKDAVPVDLGFIRRVTRRIEALQPGNLDAVQNETVTHDLEVLRLVINKKLKALRTQPQGN